MNLNTAAYYDQYWGGDACKAYLRDRQLDEIAAYIVRSIGWTGTGKTIIDIGGGVSRIARLAKQAGHKPLVVDFSQAAVDAMLAEGIDAVVADVRHWKSRVMGHYDVAVCTEVLEHLEQPEIAVKMAAAHASRAYFTVPNDCMGPEECATHLRTYDAGSLIALLSEYWRDVYVYPMHRWLIAEVAVPCTTK